MAQNPLMQMLRPSPQQQISDQLIGEIRGGDRTAQRRLNTFADDTIDAYQDPTSQGYEATAAARAKANMMRDPEIAAQHEQDLQDEERIKNGPARTTGQYAVEAASTKGDANFEALRALLAARGAGQGVSVSGVGSLPNAPRPATSQLEIANRNQLQAIRTGKAHAARPGGGGFLDWLTGPNQQDLDQSEIQRLESSLGPGGGTVSMVSPDGRPLQVPESRVQEMEALGASRVQ